jgi:hypothetical protein
MTTTPTTTVKESPDWAVANRFCSNWIIGCNSLTPSGASPDGHLTLCPACTEFHSALANMVNDEPLPADYEDEDYRLMVEREDP